MTVPFGFPILGEIVKRKSHWITYLALILLLLIPLALLVTKLQEGSTLQNEALPSKAPVNLSPPAQSALPTTKRWKTYTYSQYGFSFKCPYSWRANDDFIILHGYQIQFTDTQTKQQFTLKMSTLPEMQSLKQIGVYTAQNTVWHIYTDSSAKNVIYSTTKNGYELTFQYSRSQEKSDDFVRVLETFAFRGVDQKQ